MIKKITKAKVSVNGQPEIWLRDRLATIIL